MRPALPLEEYAWKSAFLSFKLHYSPYSRIVITIRGFIDRSGKSDGVTGTKDTANVGLVMKYAISMNISTNFEAETELLDEVSVFSSFGVMYKESHLVCGVIDKLDSERAPVIYKTSDRAIVDHEPAATIRVEKPEEICFGLLVSIGI